nr:hypothetical protein [Tanacetum cinerariifolium]
VKIIKSDNGTEFKNSNLTQLCGLKGIKREFNVPRTPQQNGIAERKNKTLIEAARTMLADTLLLIPFWAKAVNTACYVQNRVLVTKPHNKTPYEQLHVRTPSISFMRPFGCPVTILNTLNPLGKFQGKFDGGFLVGYSVCSKAFRVFNGRTFIIQETLHVNFLENKPNVAGTGPTWLFDIDSLTRTMNYQPVTAGNQTNSGAGFQDKFAAEKAGEEVDQTYMLFLVWSAGSTNPHNSDKDVAFDGKEHDFDKKKPESVVILSLSSKFEDCSNNSSNEVNAAGPIVPTVGQNFLNSSNTFSPAGPSITAVSPSYGKSSFIDASKFLDDPDMPELEDITYSDDEDVVGVEADFNNLESSFQSVLFQQQESTKIILYHKLLVICLQLLKQEEEPKRVHQALKDPSWIEDMQEELLQLKMQKVWVLDDLPYGKRAIGTKWVYRNKKDERGIHMPPSLGFMVYQMDVKSAFLYGTIEEEVYVYQPPGSEDPDYLDKVYKVVKALYGLHQAPRAWYETLATYLLENADERQVSDEFYGGTHILLGSLGISASTPIDTEKPLLKDPDGEYVNVHTYKLMICSLMYLTSLRPDIKFAVCACARFQVTPKASHLHAVKRIFRYQKGKPHLGLWYPKDSPFDLVAYSGSDYASANLDRKSTTGGCQFLGCGLISWQCKKQIVVATSSTEAEYVAAASCYAQVLWIQNQLLDYRANGN